MPVGPYPEYYATLSDASTLILNAFSDAKDELNTRGCPDTYFLEIKFESGKIMRIYDNTDVTTLSSEEQYRLYPQLNGLFKKAAEDKLY